MREERLLVLGGDAGHGHAFGVALMLEEDGQVGVDDGAQGDVHIWEDRTVSPVPTARSEELRALAQRLADVLPADVVEEVVVTGSVSRGVADEVSDVEMLVVTSEPLELEQAYGYARAGGPHRPGQLGAAGRAGSENVRLLRGRPVRADLVGARVRRGPGRRARRG